MKKMKIRLEDSDIYLKALLSAHKEILAIAENNSLYSLTKTPSHDSGGRWVELCPDDYSSEEYWLYSVPSWHLFVYQKHLNVGGETIYFYRLHEAVEGKDCLLAVLDDRVLDFTFQDSDPDRYGNSWTWGDNAWEWELIKRHIADN